MRREMRREKPLVRPTARRSDAPKTKARRRRKDSRRAEERPQTTRSDVRPDESPESTLRQPRIEISLDQALLSARSAADAGRYGVALSLLDEIREPMPEARCLRGVLLFHLERYDEAVTALREAAYLDPDDAATRRWLALVWDALDRPCDAARERRNAERIETEGGGPKP